LRSLRSGMNLSDGWRSGLVKYQASPISLDRENLSHGLGYKLKPDIYVGSIPLREFLAQFNFIARANNWNKSAKTVALATSLRGKVRAVLDGVEDFEKLQYNELESRLLLGFGEEHMAQNFYAQFTNRKQKIWRRFAYSRGGACVVWHIPSVLLKFVIKSRARNSSRLCRMVL